MKVSAFVLVGVLCVIPALAQDPHPLSGSWKARVAQTIDTGTPQTPKPTTLWYQATIRFTTLMEGTKAGTVWYVGPTFECSADLIFIHLHRGVYLFKEVPILTPTERKRGRGSCLGGIVKFRVIDEKQAQWELFSPGETKVAVTATFVSLNPLAPTQINPLEQKGASNETTSAPPAR